MIRNIWVAIAFIFVLIIGPWWYFNHANLSMPHPLLNSLMASSTAKNAGKQNVDSKPVTAQQMVTAGQYTNAQYNLGVHYLQSKWFPATDVDMNHIDYKST